MRSTSCAKTHHEATIADLDGVVENVKSDCVKNRT